MAETTEVLKENKIKVKDREPLFSKKNKKLISDPLDENNPITIQVLGICSALAVTVQMKAAVVMSVSVLFVLILANVTVSLIRNLIPNRIRIIVQLVVVAALVVPAAPPVVFLMTASIAVLRRFVVLIVFLLLDDFFLDKSFAGTGSHLTCLLYTSPSPRD